ncbi:MAG: HD domain-containing protein [Firmicutes bacterium]|nr:HD domain-containing protein [Bacillota bacterium]
MKSKLVYDYIKNDKDIINIYNEIEELEQKGENWAYHNVNHINKVTDLVVKILEGLNYSSEIIYAAKIAAIMHDVGVIEGKNNHALRSYEYTKKYFEINNIVFDNIDLVLEAIKNHSDVFETNNILCLVLTLADKLDNTKYRVTPAGYDVEGFRQFLYINDIFLEINNGILKINFEADEMLNIDELFNYYFIKKMVNVIIYFCSKLNLKYEVRINNNIWNI